MLNVNCTLFYTQNEQQLTHPNTYSVRALKDEMPCYESNQITQVCSSAIAERRADQKWKIETGRQYLWTL